MPKGKDSPRRAVGIVRVSQTAGRAGESLTSPRIQRERIAAECDREGLKLVGRARGARRVRWQVARRATGLEHRRRHRDRSQRQEDTLHALAEHGPGATGHRIDLSGALGERLYIHRRWFRDVKAADAASGSRCRRLPRSNARRVQPDPRRLLGAKTRRLADVSGQGRMRLP
jgi:hypothetical protein